MPPTTPRPPNSRDEEHGMDDIVTDLKQFVSDTEKERERRRPEEPWDWKRATSSLPKPLLVGIVFGLTSGVASLGAIVSNQIGRQDAQQDASIKELNDFRWATERDMRILASKVTDWIDVAARIDSNQRELLEENYRQYRAQAVARGDGASVRRLDRKLGAIQAQKATSEAQP